MQLTGIIFIKNVHIYSDHLNFLLEILIILLIKSKKKRLHRVKWYMTELSPFWFRHLHTFGIEQQYFAPG